MKYVVSNRSIKSLYDDITLFFPFLYYTFAINILQSSSLTASTYTLQIVSVCFYLMFSNIKKMFTYTVHYEQLGRIIWWHIYNYLMSNVGLI